MAMDILIKMMVNSDDSGVVLKVVMLMMVVLLALGIFRMCYVFYNVY